MDDDQREALLTVAEAAERLQVSTKTVRRYIGAGRLVAYRVGPTLIRLNPAEVDDLPRRIPTASGAVPVGVMWLSRGSGRSYGWLSSPGPIWLLTSDRGGRKLQRLA